jgi:hypothetical protein
MSPIKAMIDYRAYNFILIIREISLMKKLALAAAAAASILSAHTGSAVANEVLNASQIKKFVPGRAKANISGSTVVIRASTSGKLSGTWGGENDTGQWHVSGDQLCIRFNSWLRGGTHCSKVARSGNSFRVVGVTFNKY